MNTEFINNINWLAVICGALGYFALGAIWYSKVLFVTKWLAFTKIDTSDPNMKKGMALSMIMSVAWMFLTALGISILRDRMGITGWLGGLKLGTVTGLFFGVSALSISYLYEKKAWMISFLTRSTSCRKGVL